MAVAVPWIAFAALYIAIAGKTSPVELAVAAGCGLIAAAIRLFMARKGRPFAPPPGPAYGRSLGIPGAICRDAAVLTLAFLRPLWTGRWPRGRIAMQPFHPGGGNPRSRSRRGLVLAGLSLAPNTVAIDIDRPDRRLVLHQLVEGHGPNDPEWPV